jgi:hypothetical protein
MPYSLSQAAEAVGMNRSSILRAVKAGKISATRDEHDQWQIEPAELHRVYPAAPAPASSHTDELIAELRRPPRGHAGGARHGGAQCRDMAGCLRARAGATRTPSPEH